MTNTALKAVFDRAGSWPEEDQQKLINAARLIESQAASGFELDDADWEIIVKRAAEARNGAIATDEETAAFFGKYRRA